MPDLLQPGLIESAHARLSIIQMEQSWKRVLSRHVYPEAVAEQLGQLLACSVLLRARLKKGSSIILQIQGNGAVETLVAQSNPQNTLRGLAKWQASFNQVSSIQEIYGDAKLVMTLTHDQQRYQGIVELCGQTLSDSLELYLSQSEQLPSCLKLFANQQRVAGVLVQKLPTEFDDDDDWQRVKLLTQTITSEEMLNLSVTDIIKRLYHQEDVRVYDQQAVSFHCSCSRSRIDSVLETMGRDSMLELLNEKGVITVDCEFCNLSYQYKQAEIDRLFVNHVADEPESIN